MTDVESATADLLADRPELEPDIQSLLNIDDDGPWTFDDIPLDSGTFGEVVAADIVKSVDEDTYRLRDPTAVRVVVDGDTTESSATSILKSFDFASLQRRVVSVDRTLLIVLAGLLLFVAVMRVAFSWSAVFRSDHVVLLGNDPYFYRYWLDELTRRPATLGSLPTAIRTHDVFMIASLWAGTLFLGGTHHAVSTVLTWYPVVAAVVVGGLLYWIATISFGDRRVGFATLGIYAVTPILAYRSALGFGDHHAFDYLLVTIAIAGLVALVSESSHWRVVTHRRILGATAVVLAIAGQVHAWRGGPLLVAPLAVYIVITVLVDRQANRDPIVTNAWVLSSLGTAAVVALAVHASFGWSPFFRAVTPLLLFCGSIVAVGIGVLAQRLELQARTVLGAEIGGGTVTIVLAWVAIPAVRDAIAQGTTYFARTGNTGISETASLFSPELGVVIAPLSYLGVTFFLGLIGLVIVSYRLVTVDRPTWVVLVAYGWTLFAAAVVQLRFASQFGLLCAIFAGLIFIYLLSAVDLIESVGLFSSSRSPDSDGLADRSFSLPGPQVLGIIVVAFLLVGGFGFVQIVDDTGDLTITDATYETSLAIDEHATETDASWPENYVLSRWGWNRAYNYYVNGQSESYTYARNNYIEFLTATDPTPWYDRLAKKPVGYIVVEPAAGAPPESMQTRLWSNWGSATTDTAGLSHYRAIYATDDRKVYQVVPGAELSWDGAPGGTQVTQTTVTVGNETVMYKRQVTAGDDGRYSVRVPYAGTYEIGSERVTVSEAAVRSGDAISLSDSG